MKFHTRPKIYTTYFGKMNKLPPNVLPVSISLYPPRGIGIKSWNDLAPTEEMFKEWKRTGDTKEYRKSFRKYVLQSLDVRETIDRLIYLAKVYGKKHIALVCFEKDPKTCHRNWVAEYFWEQEHYEILEWDYELFDK